MSTRLYEKIYGFILGGAIADAMGAPIEGMHYKDIRREFGVVDHFLANVPRSFGGENPYETPWTHWHEKKQFGWNEPLVYGQWRLEPGVYSDDTRYMLLAFESVIKHGRRVSGREFVRDVYQYVVESAACPTDDLRFRWATGAFNSDWMAGIAGSSPFGGAWGGPAGVINACNVTAAAEDGGVMGVAVAYAMQPGATMTTVIDGVFTYLQGQPGRNSGRLRSGSDAYRFRLKKALQDADSCTDVLQLIEKLHQWICCPFPASGAADLEMVTVALTMAYKAKGNFREAVIGGVNFGRDCDTIAIAIGQLCGALGGISAIPATWAETALKMNPDPDMREVAAQLTDTIIHEALSMQEASAAILEQADLPKLHEIGGNAAS